MNWVQWVRVPELDGATRWGEAGPALYHALGANPLLVDAEQNRPPAFARLPGNLRTFGENGLVVVSAGSSVAAVKDWKPLRREVEVAGSEPFSIAFRLLDYPWWSLSIDGEVEPRIGGMPGVVACRVPPGRHTVRVLWSGNPLARVGQVAAAATILALVLLSARRRSGDRRYTWG
jgi:hypothetical protein